MLLSNATYSIMGLLICKYEPSDKKSKSSDTQVPVKARQPLVWTYMWIFFNIKSSVFPVYFSDGRDNPPHSTGQGLVEEWSPDILYLIGSEVVEEAEMF